MKWERAVLLLLVASCSKRCSARATGVEPIKSEYDGANVAITVAITDATAEGVTRPTRAATCEDDVRQKFRAALRAEHVDWDGVYDGGLASVRVEGSARSLVTWNLPDLNGDGFPEVVWELWSDPLTIDVVHVYDGATCRWVGALDDKVQVEKPEVRHEGWLDLKTNESNACEGWFHCPCAPGSSRYEFKKTEYVRVSSEPNRSKACTPDD